MCGSAGILISPFGLWCIALPLGESKIDWKQEDWRHVHSLRLEFRMTFLRCLSPCEPGTNYPGGSGKLPREGPHDDPHEPMRSTM